MSDFLESVRQALEWWEAHLGETGPVSNDLHRLNQIVLADAAGRLVRLAETGPDAAAHHLNEIHLTEDDFTYAICSCGYRTVPVDEDIWVDELMAHAVRAALADYLTEEETE